MKVPAALMQQARNPAATQAGIRRSAPGGSAPGCPKTPNPNSDDSATQSFEEAHPAELALAAGLLAVHVVEGGALGDGLPVVHARPPHLRVHLCRYDTVSRDVQHRLEGAGDRHADVKSALLTAARGRTRSISWAPAQNGFALQHVISI